MQDDDRYSDLLAMYTEIIRELLDSEDYFEMYNEAQLESISEELTKWFGKDLRQQRVKAGLKSLIEEKLVPEEDG